MPNKLTFEELHRLEKDNNNTILRVTHLDGYTLLILNDMVTHEAVSITLSGEEIVRLGKALIRAWEYNIVKGR